jgi:sulfite exporter TauE/SafE
MCRYIGQILKNGYSIVLLGVFLAIIPCVPFTSFFTQVAMEHGGWLLGAVEGITFGIGISLSVPYWILAIFSGSVPQIILRKQVFFKALKIISGVLLLIVGIKYVFDAIVYFS